MHWGQFAAAFAAETGPVRNPTTTTFRAEANRPYLRVANVYEDRLDIEQHGSILPGCHPTVPAASSEGSDRQADSTVARRSPGNPLLLADKGFRENRDMHRDRIATSLATSLATCLWFVEIFFPNM